MPSCDAQEWEELQEEETATRAWLSKVQDHENANRKQAVRWRSSAFCSLLFECCRAAALQHHSEKCDHFVSAAVHRVH